MSAPAEKLWRVNSEYQKRLAQVKTYLNLLEQMIETEPINDQERILAALRYALDQVEGMMEEHRTWRYTYYYESLETRRMVQSLNAINRALGRFTRMRIQHDRRLHDLHSLLGHISPPDPAVTRVPNGDLWAMTQFAMNSLNQFDDYIQTLA